MSLITRIKEVLLGVLTILLGLFILLLGSDAYPLIAMMLAVTLLFAGIRQIVYYFSMARFMVGGKSILYAGVVLYDIGTFAAGLVSIPKIYIMLYLLIGHLFTGLVSTLRALEAKKYEAPAWRRSLAQGMLNVLIAVLCIIFIRSQQTVVYIYCFGLLNGAVLRIVTAFRKTAIVYIA